MAIPIAYNILSVGMKYVKIRDTALNQDNNNKDITNMAIFGNLVLR